MPPAIAVSAGHSTTLVQIDMSQQIGWIVFIFCTDGLQRMKPADFGDPLAFHPVAPSSQNPKFSNTLVYYNTC